MIERTKRAEIQAALADPHPFGFHMYLFKEYEILGYDSTQKFIRSIEKRFSGSLSDKHQLYITESIVKNEQFEKLKGELLGIIRKENRQQELTLWVENKNRLNLTKEDLYSILGELAVFVQFDPEFKDTEIIYDELTEVLDRFTSWGKNHRILPDEPDVKN